MAYSEPPTLSEKLLAHTINDAALHARCGRTTIYSAIKTGHLKARKIGRRTIILDGDLRGWLAALPIRQAAQQRQPASNP